MCATSAICRIVYTIGLPALFEDATPSFLMISAAVAIVLFIEITSLFITIMTTAVAEMSFLDWALTRSSRIKDVFRPQIHHQPATTTENAPPSIINSTPGVGALLPQQMASMDKITSGLARYGRALVEMEKIMMLMICGAPFVSVITLLSVYICNNHFPAIVEVFTDFVLVTMFFWNSSALILTADFVCIRSAFSLGFSIESSFRSRVGYGPRRECWQCNCLVHLVVLLFLPFFAPLHVCFQSMIDHRPSCICASRASNCLAKWYEQHNVVNWTDDDVFLCNKRCISRLPNFTPKDSEDRRLKKLLVLYAYSAGKRGSKKNLHTSLAEIGPWKLICLVIVFEVSNIWQNTNSGYLIAAQVILVLALCVMLCFERLKWCRTIRENTVAWYNDETQDTARTERSEPDSRSDAQGGISGSASLQAGASKVYNTGTALSTDSLVVADRASTSGVDKKESTHSASVAVDIEVVVTTSNIVMVNNELNRHTRTDELAARRPIPASAPSWKAKKQKWSPKGELCSDYTSCTCPQETKVQTSRLSDDAKDNCCWGSLHFGILIWVSIITIFLNSALGFTMCFICCALGTSWCLRKPKAKTVPCTVGLLLTSLITFFAIMSATPTQQLEVAEGTPLWVLASTWNNKTSEQSSTLPYGTCKIDVNGASIIDQCFMSYAVYKPPSESTPSVSTWFAAAGRILVPVTECSALGLSGVSKYGLRFDAYVEVESASEVQSVRDACTLGSPGANEEYLGTSRHVYIVFRGSDSTWDFGTNALIWHEAFLFQALGYVGSYSSSWPIILQRLIVDVLNIFLFGVDASKQNTDAIYYNQGFSISKQYQAKFPNATMSFTGHSLGGGLSSIVGQGLDLPSVSFSGPGYKITAAKISQISKRLFDQDTIVVVPDNDIVPLIDYHAGTRQEIDCLGSNDLLQCHSIWRTCCELRRACGDPFGRTLTECTTKNVQERPRGGG